MSVAALLTVLVEQAPHTVHHLFDQEQQARPDCEFALADERGHAVCISDARLDPPSETDLGSPRHRTEPAPAGTVVPPDARAPPHFFS